MRDGPEETELRREIRLPHATAMVVGTIIGASIFVQPSEITGQVPTVTGVFLVWLVAGVLTLFGALVTAELASVFPRTGGVYVYLAEAFSPAVGFLWGWAMFWTMHSGIIAAIAVIFARYFGFFVPLGDAGTRAVAVGAVVVLSAVNYRGVKHGVVLQALFTAGKLVAIALIILVGLALGDGVGWSGPRLSAGGGGAGAGGVGAGGIGSGTVGPGGVGPGVGAGGVLPLVGVGLDDFALALVAGLFAFGGWHMVTYNADETVDPARTIPRSLVVGTVVVTLSYILLSAVYFHVLPFDTVATSDRVAADAADAVLGFGGGAAMAALVCFSTFGALSGIILAGPRVYYAMARDGLLFRPLGRVHGEYGTPHRAIVLQAAWSSVLVVTGSYRALFTRVIYTEWIFFGLMAVGLVLLRRRRPEAPAYRVWGYPVVPLLFAAAAFAIVVNQVVAEPMDSALGLGMVLVGLPVYLMWGRRSSRSARP